MAARKPKDQQGPIPDVTPEGEQEAAIEEHNPATDPSKTAQERLDALTRQHEAMRKATGGDYPL